MADTELEQLQTAIKCQWSQVPSQKVQPYVNAFAAGSNAAKCSNELTVILFPTNLCKFLRGSPFALRSIAITSSWIALDTPPGLIGW